MHIKEIKIKNFKSFQDTKIQFNSDINIFTGKNNSGKTTILEVVSLWHECFNKLIRQAGRKTKNYRKGDYILGNTQEKYFPFEEIHSVCNPNFEDIFNQCDKNKKIEIDAELEHENEQIKIGFRISSSGLNYVIELMDFTNYDFEKFNRFFRNFPFPIGLYYASPVLAIRQRENFATNPQIREAIQMRESATVLRNRLYSLYKQQQDLSLYNNFISDLSYILFNNQEQIEFFTSSDIQKDTRVIINYKLNSRDTEKDIALLGSGTLQIIEILLNLYYYEQRTDMNLVLLDEPDSHIHRDIQQRLLEILTRFSNQNQLLITTHNETIIRHSSLHHLFHLAQNSPENYYQPLSHTEINRLGERFKGIYPIPINPILSSLGSPNGLDFINAIEADHLIFVEGEDDARAIDLLLQKSVSPRNTKKYVFLVLNGINNIFKEILHYKTVFSAIKNTRTLWEKSVLIIDRDFLIDEDRVKLAQKMEEKLSLKTYIPQSYTFEAILLTDLDLLSRLLVKWVKNRYSQDIDQEELLGSLNTAYQNIRQNLVEKYLNDNCLKETTYRYIAIQESLYTIFKYKFINKTDVDLTISCKNHINNTLESGAFFKLTRKEDVKQILDESLQAYHISFNIERDFLDLLKAVDRSVWFDEWDFLRQL